MDKLQGLASKLGGGNKDSGSSSNQGGDQKDYLDKGLDAIESKFSGGKIDPAKYRDQNEKATDAIRGQFEKSTGKHVPEKFSN